ncbi:MAG: GNAT family N-acetyltransferase [Stenotrophobium sp.]
MNSSAEPRLHWQWHDWATLNPDTLYALLKLRSDIFVVEQNCVFSDMDGIDPACEHLCGSDAQGQLIAYLRLVPPGVKSEHPALGRLVVKASRRKYGHGGDAIREGIRHCHIRYPGLSIFISGQQHLEKFYTGLNFRRISGPYLEDGIRHVNMLLTAEATAILRR